MLADLVSRVTSGCRVLQEQAGEPEEEGREARGDVAAVPVGGAGAAGWEVAAVPVGGGRAR